MSKKKQVTDYACTYCKAKPGKPCKTRDGTKTAVHVNRVRQRVREHGPGTIKDDAGKLLEDGVTRRDADGHVPPQLPNTWRVAFLKSTLRTGFCLALTQPMLEQLCAVASGFEWDRFVFRATLGHAFPDNPATMGSLERRGLVRHRGTKVLRREDEDRTWNEKAQRFEDNVCDTWELTPAGEKVVELLHLTGVFVEPSAGADFRSRKQEGS